MNSNQQQHTTLHHSVSSVAQSQQRALYSQQSQRGVPKSGCGQQSVHFSQQPSLHAATSVYQVDQAQHYNGNDNTAGAISNGGIRNGNHHLAGSSGVAFDRSQNYQASQYQQQQQPIQYQAQLQQQPQKLQQQQYQYQSSHQQQNHHQYQQQQFSRQPQQYAHQQLQQQNNVHQSVSYQQQQSQQPQEQRNQNHHRRQHHKQQQQVQPRHILQKPSSAKAGSSVSSNSSGGTVTLLNKTDAKKPKEEPLLVIDTFSPDGEADKDSGCSDDHAQVEEKSHNSENTSEGSDEQKLANTKEKTPMCLINELARFNKVSHQYTLVDEQGPAHKKIFFVKLRLGEEEYSASGESIKKAQHAAAAIALSETGHPHPVPKPPRYNEFENITPTVELNALAMKRGESAVYKTIEPQQPPYFPPPGMDLRAMYGHRYHQMMRAMRDPRWRGRGGVMWPVRMHYPRMSRAFYVALRVGHREFIGDGPTRQAARHNAAQKALRILSNMPIQADSKESKEGQPAPKEEQNTAPVAEEEISDELKSEISLVHEVALRRNMTVAFEVIREAGPPHMKTFVTRCTVGQHSTEGEGCSKKVSKKVAAELMLQELSKLPPAPITVPVRPRPRGTTTKKKNRNLVKCELQQQKADPNYGVGINPISRLIQIMQAQKKKEPVYTLEAERGLPRRREFVMQVEVEDKKCTGTGPNKKLAKREAAENMLLVLGYTKPSPQPTKSAIKTTTTTGEGSHSNGDKKVHFVGDPADTREKGKSHPAGSSAPSHAPPQQRIPGLLHIPTSVSAPRISSAGGAQQQAGKEPLVNLASILKPSLRPELQLRELCKALDTELEIDDFTKKRPSGTEHIARITVGRESTGLSFFHGSSTTLESARDMAALDALRVMLGRAKELHPAGDCPQVKRDLLTRSSLSLKDGKR